MDLQNFAQKLLQKHGKITVFYMLNAE